MIWHHCLCSAVPRACHPPTPWRHSRSSGRSPEKLGQRRNLAKKRQGCGFRQIWAPSSGEVATGSRVDGHEVGSVLLCCHRLGRLLGTFKQFLRFKQLLVKFSRAARFRAKDRGVSKTVPDLLVTSLYCDHTRLWRPFRNPLCVQRPGQLVTCVPPRRGEDLLFSPHQARPAWLKVLVLWRRSQSPWPLRKSWSICLDL